MKRRDFIKTSVAAAGFAGSIKALEPLSASASQSPAPTPSQTTGPDNRPADYLRRAQGDRFLPKPPIASKTYTISPMPLKERRESNIVPRRGFCSIAPAAAVNEWLTSGNGAMNVELSCDPCSEQILFHHESLLMPWKKPFEAPNVADIFPQVRQLAKDGKHTEAMALALQRMNDSPIKQNTEPHLTVPAFLMQLDFAKTATVKDYLRTVDFESGEIKVAWTDERGSWLRQTLASRPEIMLWSNGLPRPKKASP